MPLSLLLKLIVTLDPAGTVIVVLSKATFCAVRATVVPPAGEAAGELAGEAVAAGEAVGKAVDAGEAVAAGEAAAPEGGTMIKTEATSGGFNGVWSLLTSSAERMCAPGITLGQV